MVTLLIDLTSRELERLIGLAIAVMNDHADDHGLCAICGYAWPCERVVLAAQNLAVI